MTNKIIDMFDLWDRGEFWFTDMERALIDLKGGEKIAKLLEKCTVCPVGNGTCESIISIQVYGLNPDKGHQKKEIMVCPLGIGPDTEGCPLNK